VDHLLSTRPASTPGKRDGRPRSAQAATAALDWTSSNSREAGRRLCWRGDLEGRPVRQQAKPGGIDVDVVYRSSCGSRSECRRRRYDDLRRPNRRRSSFSFRPPHPQRSFGGVFRKTDAAVVEEAGERCPAVEKVIVDRLGGIVLGGKQGSLLVHPSAELFRASTCLLVLSMRFQTQGALLA
jgi:hypothetical protein